MKNLTRGQSHISGSPITGQDAYIEYDAKTDTDTDICDIFHETGRQRHERVTRRYSEMLEKKASELYTDGAYNLRILNYPHGQQVTYYTNAVDYHQKHENLSRSHRNTERTEEERQHCINVSLARTRNNIYNIARSHDWRWFVTFTFNRTRTDADDFAEVMKKMSNNLHNTKQRICPNLKYIVVPELHADGRNYHFHGLFSGCDELRFVFSGKFDGQGRPIFNVPSWTWGFSTATLVDDSAAASNYICKYITKESEGYLFGQRRYLSNAARTQAEKHLVEIGRHELIAGVADDIRYMKDINVTEAHRKVTYMELPPGTLEVAYETDGTENTETPDNPDDN